MNITNIIKNVLEHPLVDILATFWKKFISSKSYWSVNYFLILLMVREAGSLAYSAILTDYVQKKLEGTTYSRLWSTIEFIFGFGGNWFLLCFVSIIFLLLWFAKVSEGENNTISLKENFLSLLLSFIIMGMGIYMIRSNDSNHDKTHKQEQITHEKLNEIHKQEQITHVVLGEIKALIKLQGGDETLFLEKYFGEDYEVLLKHPQTYHNFTTLLKQTNKTADELLQEREELLKKIESQSFSPKLQTQIDKSFKELRYEDVRELLDAFLEANEDKEKEIIKAHYVKALTYMKQIRYHKAREEFEKIAPNIDDVGILFDSATMYYALGKYDKAIEYHERVLEIRVAILGKIHPDIATSYNNIGLAWHRKGDFNKTIEYYEKALEIRIATLGRNHPDTATSYNNIGGVWHSKEKYDKAIEYYERALKIRVSTLEKNHFHIAISYNNIGLAWYRKGDFNKTIEYYEKALEIRIATLGRNHPDTATSYNNIGLVWHSKEKYNKAIRYYEKTLKILRHVFPNGHLYIDIATKNLKSAKESLKNEK